MPNQVVPQGERGAPASSPQGAPGGWLLVAPSIGQRLAATFPDDGARKFNPFWPLLKR